MVDINKLMLENLNGNSISNIVNKINYISNSAKKFSKEELTLLEQGNYTLGTNILSDLDKVNYEIKNSYKFLEDNELDLSLIKFVKSCLNEVKLLVEKEQLSQAKQLITLVQVTLGILPGFFIALVDLNQKMEEKKLLKKETR
ncbi:MAG: hypothetical protein IJO33_01930 [Bacilli bacterium]|nr:hypothetical protein [Bacilli bacterium]